MDDSSNGRAVALYLADPGSNPHITDKHYIFVLLRDIIMEILHKENDTLIRSTNR